MFPSCTVAKYQVKALSNIIINFSTEIWAGNQISGRTNIANI